VEKKRDYVKPTLVRREKLSQITAATVSGLRVG
jgi:hypothetical protein